MIDQVVARLHSANPGLSIGGLEVDLRGVVEHTADGRNPFRTT